MQRTRRCVKSYDADAIVNGAAHALAVYYSVLLRLHIKPKETTEPWTELYSCRSDYSHVRPTQEIE